MRLSTIVELLLDAGARVDAVTDKGYPALYWAIAGSGDKKDKVGTIRLLRARGPNPLDHLIRVPSIAEEIRVEFADLL